MGARRPGARPTRARGAGRAVPRGPDADVHPVGRLRQHLRQPRRSTSRRGPHGGRLLDARRERLDARDGGHAALARERRRRGRRGASTGGAGLRARSRRVGGRRRDPPAAGPLRARLREPRHGLPRARHGLPPAPVPRGRARARARARRLRLVRLRAARLRAARRVGNMPREVLLLKRAERRPREQNRARYTALRPLRCTAPRSRARRSTQRRRPRPP
mmetsp:Transcript_20577/g.61367  ORF Transcript_20577/g.61367 Transcript_20577/m.61367 type:complete len:218 (+) Transcript_20577:199-852(+)